MLPYIINVTAIWLLSLLLFDVTLRRQRMHSYNRLYLLTTLLAGIVLPLVPLRQVAATYAPMPANGSNMLQNLREVTAPSVVADTTAPVQLPWLTILYAAGVLVTLTLLAVEISKLVRYSLKGRRSQDGQWTIVETGGEHAPFSFLRRLYVGKRDQYTDTEWQMIMLHEGSHTRLLHFADLLLLHIVRIAFWFHPLVYVYHRRLLMVHEYQADATAEEPATYGRFLVEQAVFHAAPSVTHSLNYSPIKNRITMLTKNKTRNQPLRMLVVVPLLLVAAGCFTKETTKRTFERNGNEVTYNGNKFKMSESKTDTIMMMDPVSGDTVTQVVATVPTPVEMNGQKIYTSSEASPAEYIAGSNILEEVVNKSAAAEMTSLPDGDYWIDMNNVVVNENGKVVFYEFRGLRRMGAKPSNTVSADSIEKMVAAIDNALNEATAMKPATANGKNVASLVQTKIEQPIFHVQDHHVTFGNPTRM